MDQRELGKSGIAIAPLMLGGNVFGWTADEAASFAVLDAFVDQGGDAIDTADSYSAWLPGHTGGESETIMGRWLKASGKRSRVVIATKVGKMPARQGIRRDNIIAAAEESLGRLQTDVIDLYQLHADDDVTPPEEYLAALDSLIKAGKVRAIGVSNFGAVRLSETVAAATAKGLPRCETLQPEYNLLSRGIERDLMPVCEREGVSLIPFAGLASGYLTGKYRSSADKSKSARGGRMDKYMEGKGPAILAALENVGGRHDASIAQVALAWVMAQPAVAATIASATSTQQLTGLMGALRVTLSADDLALIDSASA